MMFWKYDRCRISTNKKIHRYFTEELKHLSIPISHLCLWFTNTNHKFAITRCRFCPLGLKTRSKSQNLRFPSDTWKYILDLWFATGGHKSQIQVSTCVGIVFVSKTTGNASFLFRPSTLMKTTWSVPWTMSTILYRETVHVCTTPSCTSNDVCCWPRHPHGPCAAWRVTSARPRQTSCCTRNEAMREHLRL